MFKNPKICALLYTLSMMFTILASMLTALSLMSLLLPGAEIKIGLFIVPLIGLIFALIGNFSRKYFKNKLV